MAKKFLRVVNSLNPMFSHELESSNDGKQYTMCFGFTQKQDNTKEEPTFVRDFNDDEIVGRIFREAYNLRYTYGHSPVVVEINALDIASKCSGLVKLKTLIK